MNSFLDWLDNEIKKSQLNKETMKAHGDYESATHFDIQQLAYEQCRANYIDKVDEKVIDFIGACRYAGEGGLPQLRQEAIEVLKLMDVQQRLKG